MAPALSKTPELAPAPCPCPNPFPSPYPPPESQTARGTGLLRRQIPQPSLVFMIPWHALVHGTALLQTAIHALHKPPLSSPALNITPPLPGATPAPHALAHASKPPPHSAHIPTTSPHTSTPPPPLHTTSTPPLAQPSSQFPWFLPTCV